VAAAAAAASENVITIPVLSPHLLLGWSSHFLTQINRTKSNKALAGCCYWGIDGCGWSVEICKVVVKIRGRGQRPLKMVVKRERD
jgi:hypothetical protein